MNLLGQLFNIALTYPILNGLLALYHLLGDFGFAVIMLTVIAFLLMLPFLHRQTKALKAQQALQPEIEAIKRSHPNDRLAQTAAQQQLFKERGVPLMPPIIPMLVQGLILSGVFFALNMILRKADLSTLNAILYPFLPHFTSMPDLNLNWFTLFNAAWHISLGLPDPTHILPILAGVVTFIQMRMAQPLNLAETKETMQQASHILQLLMPLLMVGITIFFAWQFAAGVALYRLAYLILSTIRQYFITGWGSLWLLPDFATTSGTAILIPPPQQQTAPKHRHRSGGSARRRKNPKRKK
jgi:YidC/Oxa1 family membrane protein insertase